MSLCDPATMWPGHPAKAGSLSGNIVVQGSRARGTAKLKSDLDLAVRLPEGEFDNFVKTQFGRPSPGSAKERTMLHAIKTGKVQSGEAGLRGIRLQLEQALGMKVDISVIRVGGPFDSSDFIPLF